MSIWCWCYSNFSFFLFSWTDSGNGSILKIWANNFTFQNSWLVGIQNFESNINSFKNNYCSTTLNLRILKISPNQPKNLVKNSHLQFSLSLTLYKSPHSQLNLTFQLSRCHTKNLHLWNNPIICCNQIQWGIGNNFPNCRIDLRMKPKRWKYEVKFSIAMWSKPR